MASGSSDPVRKATKESWPTLVKDLVWTGSDGNGGIYCQTETAGTMCDTYWSTSGGPADPDQTTDCDIAVADLGDVLANCSSIQLNTNLEPPAWFEDTDRAKNCNQHYTTCDACSTACMEASIAKVKDQMLPASYFTFFLCFYLVVVVCFNQIALGADEIE